MPFWLVAFVMVNGQYDHKTETRYPSKIVCHQHEQTIHDRNIVTFCLSDSHHRGQSVDNGVPLD